jgi:hypothetical protein
MWIKVTDDGARRAQNTGMLKTYFLYVKDAERTLSRFEVRFERDDEAIRHGGELAAQLRLRHFPNRPASSSRSSTNRAEKSTSNLFIPRTIKEPEHEPNGEPQIEQVVVRIEPATQLPRLRPSSYMLRCSR